MATEWGASGRGGFAAANSFEASGIQHAHFVDRVAPEKGHNALGHLGGRGSAVLDAGVLRLVEADGRSHSTCSHPALLPEVLQGRIHTVNSMFPTHLCQAENVWDALERLATTPTIAAMSFETFMRQLGATVKARRLALKLTQVQLADELDGVGIDQAAISRIEAGDQGLRTETLYALAVALKTHPSELVSGQMATKASPKARPLHAPVTDARRMAELGAGILAKFTSLIDDLGPEKAARIAARFIDNPSGAAKQSIGRRTRKRAKSAAERQT